MPCNDAVNIMEVAIRAKNVRLSARLLGDGQIVGALSVGALTYSTANPTRVRSTKGSRSVALQEPIEPFGIAASKKYVGDVNELLPPCGAQSPPAEQNTRPGL